MEASMAVSMKTRSITGATEPNGGRAMRSAMVTVMGLCLFLIASTARAHDDRAGEGGLFDRSNLVAWCIVPFDGKKRGPEDRAAMMEKLGLRKFAYDWRAQHLPQFEDELAALKKHGIELTAVWFPGSLDADARFLLEKLRAHGIKTQLWVTGGGAPTKTEAERRNRVQAEADRVRPIAEAAAAQGCQVALYNHGGWFGEPENQLAILDALRMPNVGLVYNLHHGHEHLDRFPALLQAMKPHLLALNLNGMKRGGGAATGDKIVVLGQGDLDLSLLKTIRDSGWRGPVGILNHTDEDAEVRLRANLNGLEKLKADLGP
jgi:sugar phosphate isomerase/epimerase